MLFERFAESGMTVIPRCQRDFGDVYRAHPQFASRPFQAHPPDITDDALARRARKDAMQMRHRESGDVRQYFAIEGLVDMIADVSLHIVDTVLMVLSDLWFSQHRDIIVEQNSRSLCQMYHASGQQVSESGKACC